MIWLAPAVRANGDGKVLGTELVAKKAACANAHIEEPRLSDIVEIRVGDALETLRSLPGEVALKVLRLQQPSIRVGAVAITDNVSVLRSNFRDYVSFIRDPRNGFSSTLLPLGFGTEPSMRTTDARAEAA